MITTVNADQVAPEKRILHIFRNDLYGFSFRLEEFLVFLTSPGFLAALEDSRVYVGGLNNGKSIKAPIEDNSNSRSGSEMSGEGAQSKSQIADRKACGKDYSDDEDEDFEDSTSVDEDATTDTATDAADEDVIPPPTKKLCTEPHPVLAPGDIDKDGNIVGDPEAGEMCTH
jgi:hypothetical protein